MSERKYSVSEIDAMRRAVRLLMTSNGPWQDAGNGCRSRISHPPQRESDVEERLRTYMLAGTDPEELTAAAKAHDA